MIGVNARTGDVTSSIILDSNEPSQQVNLKSGSAIVHDAQNKVVYVAFELNDKFQFMRISTEVNGGQHRVDFSKQYYPNLVGIEQYDSWTRIKRISHLHLNEGKLYFFGRLYGRGAIFRTGAADLSVDWKRTMPARFAIDPTTFMVPRKVELNPSPRGGLLL